MEKYQGISLFHTKLKGNLIYLLNIGIRVNVMKKGDYVYNVKLRNGYGVIQLNDDTLKKRIMHLTGLKMKICI